MTLDVKLAGRMFSIDLDGSDWYDDHTYSDGSDPATMLDSFEAQLASSADADFWLDLLASAPTPVAIWRRVLTAAAQNAALAAALGPLDELVHALAIHQLATALAAVVRAQLPGADESVRESIEAQVLASVPEGEPEDWEAYRARELHLHLLHALDRSLVSEAVGAVMDASPKPHDPKLRLGGAVTFDPYEAITDAGDHHVAELVGAIEAFGYEHLNSTPNAQQLAERVGDINELENLIEGGYSGVLAERAADLLVRVAALWARCPSEVAGNLHLRARGRLLAAVPAARPEPAPDRRDEPDTDVVVIDPGPRTDAGRGLMALARLRDHVDDELIEAIESLARDPVRSVRHEVVIRVTYLRQTAPEVAWRILQERAGDETDEAVLRQVVFEAWNLRSDMCRALDVIEIVARRSTGARKRHSSAAACAEVTALLWVLFGDERAGSILATVLDLDVLDADAISSVLHTLRKHGHFADEDAQVRGRTLSICERLTEQGIARIQRLEVDPPPSEDDAPWIREGGILLDAITHQLYFAVGVHDAQQQDNRPPTAAELRLVEEAATLFDVLARVPIARVAHHLVEVQAFTLDSRPAQALRSLATVVAGGTRGTGYALESQAVKVLVSVVSTLLADHRSLFDDQDNLTALRTILEVFIEEGTPDAHQLIYGIGQIFR